MNETFASAELTVFTVEGAKTKYSLGLGQLEAIFRLPGLDAQEEDPLFSKETFEMDPYFDREMQAELRAAIRERETKGGGIRFDPRGKSLEEVEAAFDAR
jgi:hypothetical protein